MATPTYVPLATQTLGSAASSVTFSSIPATYRDLVIVIDGTQTAVNRMGIRMNGDTSTSNYSDVNMEGNGSSTASGSQTGASYISLTNGWGATSRRFISSTQIMDYSATDKHKTVLSRQSAPEQNVLAWAGRWASTSAVTTLSLIHAGSDNFAIGSTFSLYGVN